MKLPFSDAKPFQRDALSFLLKRSAESDQDLIPIALNHRPMFLVNNPELVKPILKFPEHQVTKGALIQKLRSVIGDSIVILTGKEHKRRRDALNPFFLRSNVEKLAPKLSAEIRRSAAVLSQTERFDVHDFGSSIALRLVSIAVFGDRVLTAADEQVLVNAVRMIEEDVADEIFRVFPQAPWSASAAKQRRETSRAFMETVVSRVRKSAANTSAMQTLNSLGLNETDLVNEILTLLLAGHHTTGAAVTWIVHALATVDGLCDSIAAEAAELANDNGEIDVSRLGEARTTLSTVLETIRLYPSSWWFSREAIEPVELAGKKLVKGTSLLICPWLFHRSPKYWDDPDKFKLDRNYRSPAYLPFGGGPRICIGQTLATLELQLIALELASSFRIQIEGTEHKPRPMVMLMPPEMSATIQVRDGELDDRTKKAA